MTPRVSVCVCTYNGAQVLERAIDSILSQSYDDLELVVVDDASTDTTVELLQGHSDPRIRLVRNRRNLGNAGNRSLAIRLSKGEFVKFVDQDDWITEDCLEQHVRIMGVSPAVGLTFSRRALEAAPSGGPATQQWIDRHSDPQRGLGYLEEVTEGQDIVRKHLTAGLHENWIGEPTSVMLRRSALALSGLFNLRLRQTLDLDLWMRVLAFSDAGFIDAELATRTVGELNETEEIRSRRRDWLDRLWLLEGLKQVPEVWERFPELAEMLAAERRSMLVSLWTGRFRTQSLPDALTDVAHYGAYAAAAAAGRGRPLFDCL